MKATVSKTKPWILRGAMLGLICTALGGVYAFKVIYDRPGETALSLAPADSLLVASVDLSPSPSQTLTFKNIEDALKENGMKEPFEKSIVDIFEHSPSAAGLRDLTTRSVSGCLLESQGKGEKDGAIFLPVSDASAAQKILETNGVGQYWKGTKFYLLKNSTSHMMMMIEGSNLVLSDQGWVMHEIAEVAGGQRAAFVNTEAYRSVRAKAAADANVIVMVSPKLVAEGAKKPAQAEHAGWLVASIRIEENGLAMGMSGKFDAGSDPAWQKMAEIAPLRKDLLQVLPTNAYGIMATSQPSKYYDVFNESLPEGSARKSVEDMKQSFVKETGIDIDKDVLPALQGDAIVGIYPSQSPAAGVDMLLVLDNQNGANPENLGGKLQEYIDRQVKKGSGDKNWVRKIDRPDAVEFRISQSVEKDMHKGLNFDGGAIKFDVLVGKKTVAWAAVNGTVMISSSQDLLDKALASYESKTDSLAGDAKIASEADPSDGSQTIAVLSPSRIAEGIRNTLNRDKMDAQGASLMDGILSIFQDLKMPLSIKGHILPDGTSESKVFIPMDYVKLIDVIGKQMNHK